MSWWGNRLSAQSGDGAQQQYSSSGANGHHHEPAVATGNKQYSPPRPKRSSSKKVDDDAYYNGSGTYGSTGNYPGSTGAYNGGTMISTTPYYNYGSPYGNNGGNSNSSYGSPYGNGGGGEVASYNGPSAGHSWGSTMQDSATPAHMYISTKEVHFYGMPAGSQNENDYRRRGNGEERDQGGFFRPALEAVGHYFDRKFGLHDKNY